MATRKTAAKKEAPKPERKTRKSGVHVAKPIGPYVRGEVVQRGLDTVKPNDWNPNELTPFQRASLKQGMLEDGWVASQALLIWGKDDKGKARDVILDGEHRWEVATELAFKTGPMVVIDGLSLAEAKAFTVKMDARRGKFNNDLLGELLRSIESEFKGGLTGMSIGVEDDLLVKLLAGDAAPLGTVPAGERPVIAVGEGVTSTNPNIRMVPLYFVPERHETFAEAIKLLSTRFKLETVSDVVERAVLEAAAAQSR